MFVSNKCMIDNDQSLLDLWSVDNKVSTIENLLTVTDIRPLNDRFSLVSIILNKSEFHLNLHDKSLTNSVVKLKDYYYSIIPISYNKCLVLVKHHDGVLNHKSIFHKMFYEKKSCEFFYSSMKVNMSVNKYILSGSAASVYINEIINTSVEKFESGNKVSVLYMVYNFDEAIYLNDLSRLSKQNYIDLTVSIENLDINKYTYPEHNKFILNYFIDKMDKDSVCVSAGSRQFNSLVDSMTSLRLLNL